MFINKNPFFTPLQHSIDILNFRSWVVYEVVLVVLYRGRRGLNGNVTCLATIVIDQQYLCVCDMSANVITYMKLHQNMSDSRCQ